MAHKKRMRMENLREYGKPHAYPSTRFRQVIFKGGIECGASLILLAVVHTNLMHMSALMVPPPAPAHTHNGPLF